MTTTASTVPRRQLGRHLRMLREEAGLSVDDVAREIDLSAPTIYRIEKGTTPARVSDVKEYCDICGADPQTREALAALAKEAKTPFWWRNYNGGVPKWFDTYVGLEGATSHIRAYEAEVVFGLFQTQAYADATFRAMRPASSDSEREQRVAVRMQRQNLLSRRKPPQIDAILGEAALIRSPGSKVMAEQLRRLDEVSRLPHVSIRVLPLEAMHSALGCGSRFICLTFPQGRRGISEPPVVYTDSLCGAHYLDKTDEIASFHEVWQDLLTVALSPADSQKVIKSYLERQT